MIEQNKLNRLKNLSLILFYYTLFVILWGAWVRISHSGDGCGDTWPLCGGQLVPEANQKTWTEYFHRLTSGFYGLFVLYLFLISKKVLTTNNPARRFFTLALVFTITEALLGAKLVLFGLVGQNSSLYRLFVMSLHQLNSLLLSGFVFMCYYSLHLQIKNIKSESATKLRTYKPALLFLLLAVSGALAALASTLFPSESLFEGLMKDFSQDSHLLTRLRVLHPLLALTLGISLVYIIAKSIKNESENFWLDLKTDISRQTMAGLIAALLIGGLTLITLSPITLKIIHLAMAHLVWGLVLRWCVRQPESQN